MLVDGSSARETHELTASEAWSYHDVTDTLIELSGTQGTYVPVERPEFEARIRERGLPERAIQFALNVHSDVRNDLLDEIRPELEQLLGRKPASLRDGLQVLFNL